MFVVRWRTEVAFILRAVLFREEDEPNFTSAIRRVDVLDVVT